MPLSRSPWCPHPSAGRQVHVALIGTSTRGWITFGDNGIVNSRLRYHLIRICSAQKFMLRHSTRAGRPEGEHVAALVISPRPYATILTCGDVQRVPISATPSCTSHVARRKADIREMLSSFIEAHDSIRCEYCNPEVAFCAEKPVSIASATRRQRTYSTTIPSGSPKESRRSINNRLLLMLPVSISKS